MSHLGRRLTALVDGELSPADRDRALAHLARCAACRAEAKELRELKRRMRGLADLAAGDELTQRLIAIPGPGDPVRASAGAAGPASATWRSVSRRAS